MFMNSAHTVTCGRQHYAVASLLISAPLRKFLLWTDSEKERKREKVKVKVKSWVFRKRESESEKWATNMELPAVV